MNNKMQDLLEAIDCEGFDYALRYSDDHSGIPDEDFQKLYQNYLESRAQLVQYLGVDA